MITQYKVNLYKDDELLKTTNITISDQVLTMEEVAARAKTLMLVAGYDRDYDGFAVYDPTEEKNLYMDLIEN